MKLLSAAASPFVAKAAMALRFAGLDFQIVSVDATNGDPALDEANPLSKIPCLVLDDGTGLFDSRSITRYGDRISGGKLFPVPDPDRMIAERMEALSDGICDCAVGIMYEGRFRPGDIVHQPWIDRLWGKAERGLDEAASDLPPLGADLHAGSIALAATLGYLELRFAGKWENGRDRLVSFAADFAKAHPELAELLPRA
ncbi:MAG: glutathione S-transferase family protein [Ahrensia sp.]|nr:glutathione S-transferase family protein [Ahrensia sp.]